MALILFGCIVEPIDAGKFRSALRVLRLGRLSNDTKA